MHEIRGEYQINEFILIISVIHLNDFKKGR
jgi:hypothetical protein